MLAKPFLTLVIPFPKPELLRKGGRGNVGGGGIFVCWGPLLLEFPEGFWDEDVDARLDEYFFQMWMGERASGCRWRMVMVIDQDLFPIRLDSSLWSIQHRVCGCVCAHSVWPRSAIVSVCVCLSTCLAIFFLFFFFDVAAAAAIRRLLLMIMTLWWRWSGLFGWWHCW